jgi:hypothetical protein
MHPVSCFGTTGFCDNLAKFDNHLFVVHENNDLRAFEDYGINLCDSNASSQIDTSFRDIPSSFFILDVSDKFQPKKVSSQIFFCHPINSAVGSKYVYVANGGEIGNNNEGLTIFGFCSADSLVEISRLNLPGKCESVFLKDKFVFTCNWENGLFIIDVSDPFLPKQVSQFNTPGLAYSVFVKDNLAFIADGGNGLMVADISYPDNPKLVGHLFTDDFALDVKVQNDVAYIADRFGGLQLVDVTNPTIPTIISKYPQVSDPVLYTSVKLLGNKVFAAGGGFLDIIDASTLTNPIKLGGYQAPTAIYDIEVNDSLLYIALGLEGISVLNISVPDSVKLIINVQTPGLVFDIEAKRNLLYVSDYYSLSRLKVISKTETMRPYLPADFELFQNYPNPFNGNTIITYRLYRSSFIALDVYNVLGERIASLVNQLQPAGFHSTCWSGLSEQGVSVSSGVYFYQIRSNGLSYGRKMVLLK